MNSLPIGTPGVGDLIAWAITWSVAQALKKYADGTTWAYHVRRFLPLVAMGIGVGVQMMLYAFMEGSEDWKHALIRGLYTGGAAVMGHNLYRSTAMGKVKSIPLPAPPQLTPPSESDDDGGEGVRG